MEIVYYGFFLLSASENLAFLAGHEIRNLHESYLAKQISCNRIPGTRRRKCSDRGVNPFNDLDIIQFAFLRMHNDIFPLVCLCGIESFRGTFRVT